MDGVLHRLMMDTYFKLHQLLFWTCPGCEHTVQRYLMNGTRVDTCGLCDTQQPERPEMPLDEDINEGDRL